MASLSQAPGYKEPTKPVQAAKAISQAPEYKAPPTQAPVVQKTAVEAAKEYYSAPPPTPVEQAKKVYSEPPMAQPAPTPREILPGHETATQSIAPETPAQAAERILPQMSPVEKQQLAAVTTAKTLFTPEGIEASVAGNVYGDYSKSVELSKRELATQLELKQKPAEYYGRSALEVATGGVLAPATFLVGGAAVGTAAKAVTTLPRIGPIAARAAPAIGKTALVGTAALEGARIGGMAAGGATPLQIESTIASDVILGVSAGAGLAKGLKLEQPPRPSLFVEKATITPTGAVAEIESTANVVSPAGKRFVVESSGTATIPAEEFGISRASVTQKTSAVKAFAEPGKLVQRTEVTSISKKLPVVVEYEGVPIEELSLHRGLSRISINPKKLEVVELTAGETAEGQSFMELRGGRFTKETKIQAAVSQSLIKATEKGYVAVTAEVGLPKFPSFKEASLDAKGITFAEVRTKTPEPISILELPPSGPPLKLERPNLASVTESIQSSTVAAAGNIAKMERATLKAQSSLAKSAGITSTGAAGGYASAETYKSYADVATATTIPSFPDRTVSKAVTKFVEEEEVQWFTRPPTQAETPQKFQYAPPSRVSIEAQAQGRIAIPSVGQAPSQITGYEQRVVQRGILGPATVPVKIQKQWPVTTTTTKLKAPTIPPSPPITIRTTITPPPYIPPTRLQAGELYRPYGYGRVRQPTRQRSYGFSLPKLGGKELTVGLPDVVATILMKPRSRKVIPLGRRIFASYEKKTRKARRRYGF